MAHFFICRSPATGSSDTRDTHSNAAQIIVTGTRQGRHTPCTRDVALVNAGCRRPGPVLKGEGGVTRVPHIRVEVRYLFPSCKANLECFYRGWPNDELPKIINAPRSSPSSVIANAAPLTVDGWDKSG